MQQVSSMNQNTRCAGQRYQVNSIEEGCFFQLLSLLLVALPFRLDNENDDEYNDKENDGEGDVYNRGYEAGLKNRVEEIYSLATIEPAIEKPDRLDKDPV